MSVLAWQKAVDSLPEGNLSGEEGKQKEQYQAGLDKAKSKSEPRASDWRSRPPKDPPWVLAEELQKKLMAEGKADEFLKSSVSAEVIVSARHRH
jgi:hypothetical protein